MAVMLDALAAYIQNILTKMVEEEVHMLLGVPNEINKMNTKLTDLKRFLADADKRNITDESVREWVKEFRGAMYDATDILDLCLLNAMEQGPTRDMRCFNSLLFCIRNPLHAHNIGSRLKTFNDKIDDIGKRSTPFNFILTSYEDHGRKKESLHLASRETTGELDKLDVVGEKIEEDTRKFVELLTREEETKNEHNKIMVFAIIGVGGIGKTTLVQNIFNNEIIQKEFQKKIWLSVNQNFNEIDLLKRTITEAQGDHSAAGDTKATLVRVLEEALKGCKTLLVMDDVWDHKAWEVVLKPSLKNILARGSRVVVTTRHDMVAQGIKAEKPFHHVNKLEDEDAWSLLKKQVVRDEDDEVQIDILLKDIGMGIVARCDGLPLAVKAMGGLLSQKMMRRRDWENVLNDFVWSASQICEDLNHAIYLSYQDLHCSLKPCFLHFSLIPKGAKFVVNEIVGMWISEGLIQGSSRDMEELGREYYNELVLRNLIEPDIRYVDQQVCNMHDVVRWFAQYVARDEALVAHGSKTDIMDRLNQQKFIRRLSVETNGLESEQLEWTSLQKQVSLRTLISVGPINIKPSDSLVTFSFLRTLHVQGTDCDALVQSLVQLKHLRYLSIKNTNTYMLPENIGNKMKFLQYISVFGCQSLVELPSSIGKLLHLRYLNLNGSSINNVPRGFSGLTNLRKLYGFPAHMEGDWCSLEALGPLSNLTELSIECLENVSSSLFVRKARLCEKVRLNILALFCTIGHGDDGKLEKQQQIEEVFDELCPPPSLENLDFNGYFGRRLPVWMMTATGAFLGNLRNIMIEDLPCCTELPESLCQLPNLELLKIKSAAFIKKIGPEFLQPHNYEHPRPLKDSGSALRLEVRECPSLKRIGNIPKMQELTIAKCQKLKVLEGMSALGRLMLLDYKMETLPGYLRDVNPMQLLQVDCNISLLTSIAAGESGPEWDKFCHARQVKAYAPDYDNNIRRKWYVVYTRDPFSFKTNNSRFDID